MPTLQDQFKQIRTPLLIGLCLMPLAGTPTAWAGTAKMGDGLFDGQEYLRRGALVQTVLDRNPDAKAARFAWQALLAIESQVGALDDPIVSYAFGPLSVRAGSRFGQVIQLRQRLPFPGKLGLRSKIADAEAEATRQHYEHLRIDLALRASHLFDGLYLVDRSLEVVARKVVLFEALKQSAIARYASGQGSQQGPLQAESGLMHAQHREIVLRSDRDVLVAQVNALLHRRPTAILPAPPAARATTATSTPNTAELVEQAVSLRPELQALRHRRDSAVSSAELSKRQYYPDIEVQGSYSTMWGDIDHRFMVGVAVNLPIQFSARLAAVTEAEAKMQRQAQRLASSTDRVSMEVEVATRRVDEARHVVALFNSRLEPIAHDRAKAARSDFESGRATFSELIDTERHLLTTELEHYGAIAALSRRVAELNRAVGILPGNSDGGPK